MEKKELQRLRKDFSIIRSRLKRARATAEHPRMKHTRENISQAADRIDKLESRIMRFVAEAK